MRMVRISPKMPATVTPMASATAMQPSGISSIAPRVEIGFDQLSGVARSSRTGTKRKREGGPDRRLPPGASGIGPLIQQRRMPFFSSIVVMVAVVISRSVSSSAALIVLAFHLGKSVGAQAAGRTGRAAVAPVVPMRAVAEIAGVGVLDQQVDEASPPISCASAKVAALSIHISGVWITKRRSMPRLSASCMALMVSSRQSG